MNNQCNSHNGSQRLNVFFHGAFAFDQTSMPGWIRALIPRMDYHVYRAGNWLAETELRGGTAANPLVYRLEGVMPGGPGGDRLKDDANLLVQPGQASQPDAPYATLELPVPEKVTSMLVAELPSNAFSIAAELVHPGPTQHVGTLQVFTYDIDKLDSLALSANDGNGHYWEPSPVGNFVNLHIFSAEDHYHKPPRTKEDLNLCLALLAGVQTRLDTDRLQASGVLQSPPLPDGVTEAEIETLALRTQRMAYLGRLIRQPGADVRLAWEGTHALDGDAEACGPVAG